ncbi:MAG: type I methionyl aminopeptidase [Clostridia bacterium]|nr:type I methionyl aminopeptidase [Clostridia bacterium]
MIVIKSKDEIEIMRVPCRMTGELLNDLAGFIRPGLSTKDIDRFCESYIKDHGMIPTFKGYGGFPGNVCVSVNEEVVHGIPDKKRILKEGDIVSVDVGAIYKGYTSDAARTYPVGEISEEAARLIRVTRESFFAGIEFARPGCRLSDISHAVQMKAEGEGFSVIRDFVGHGVGRELHEDPQVPNYGRAGRGPRLQAGMVLAIEPMIAAGDYETDTLLNNWTAVTVDGSYAAHYENTVAIAENGPEILTLVGNEV